MDSFRGFRDPSRLMNITTHMPEEIAMRYATPSVDPRMAMELEINMVALQRARVLAAKNPHLARYDYVNTVRDRPLGQGQSPFFARLPPEVRLRIYGYLWAGAGGGGSGASGEPRQHIYRAEDDKLAQLTHARCVVDPDAPDDRLGKCLEAWDRVLDFRIGTGPPNMSAERQAEVEFGLCYSRLAASRWCKHWACEEAPDPKPSSASFSTFLAPLLVCKQMHDEAEPSLYGSVAFSFVGLGAFDRFLNGTPAPALARLRTVHILWREDDLGERPAWNDLGRLLPQLRELRIWLSAPAPWNPRVYPLYEGPVGPVSGGVGLERLTVHMEWSNLLARDVPVFPEGYPFEFTATLPLSQWEPFINEGYGALLLMTRFRKEKEKGVPPKKDTPVLYPQPRRMKLREVPPPPSRFEPLRFDDTADEVDVPVVGAAAVHTPGQSMVEYPPMPPMPPRSLHG